MKRYSEKIIIFIASGFYSGFAPFVPGTFGSLTGLILFSPFIYLGKSSLLFFSIIIFIIGIIVSGKAELISGKKDPSYIVIDEIMGMLVSLLYLPYRSEVIISAFFLFRFLDITKPFPSIEDIKGGWGVMLDDLAAAILTNLILQVFFNLSL